MAAARMRLLTGPAAEPIARLMDEHASAFDLRTDDHPRTPSTRPRSQPPEPSTKEPRRDLPADTAVRASTSPVDTIRVTPLVDGTPEHAAAAVWSFHDSAALALVEVHRYPRSAQARSAPRNAPAYSPDSSPPKASGAPNPCP
ncbi:hypothetical protein ACQPXT_13635 [Streptomyces sp. CA-100214]